jgi:hypothetical protein
VNDRLDRLNSALDELADKYQSEVERNYQRNHLSDADHEMIRRGFAKWDAIRNVPLSEQAILVKREVKQDVKVLGLSVSHDVQRGPVKPVSRKKRNLQTSDDTDALQGLHSHLSALRASRRKPTGAE